MRREKLVTITTEGRDLGKTFKITEMSPFQAEKWAMRAFLALAKSGLEVPEETSQAGLAGIASMGLQAFAGLPWDQAEPLLDEMMVCVQVAPNLVDPTKGLRPIMPFADDIEEVKTLLTLRKEVLELHLGFSLADKLSPSGQSASNPTTT